ncbi:hypothetical protein MMC30_009088 [Trapelia coarctata]|nr:hypothetical protein [Trapelia coarctata]
MSSLFINTYQLYKKQTDQLAQWLLDTAVLCGYPPPESAPSTANGPGHKNESAGPGGPKGKDRKKATEQSEELPAAEGTPPYSIRLSQFVELAKVIAERTESNVRVPATVIALVQQVIKMRKSLSKFYIMQGRSNSDIENLQGNNQSHMYFISRLEEVYRLLDSAVKDPANATTQSDQASRKPFEPKDVASIDEVANRFSILEVEEPIDLDIEPSAPTPSASASAEVAKLQAHRNVVYDTDEDDDELDFAIFCLFEDLRRVREFLSQIWHDYKSGKLDLMTTSIITNTAFGFVQSLDADFCRAHPTLIVPKFHNNPIMSIYLVICMISGVDIRFRNHPDDMYNYQMKEIGEFFFLPVYLLLEAFSRVIQPGGMPEAKKGHYGTYNPKADRGKMSYRQKIMEDKILLLENLPSFCLLGQARHDVFVLDELTAGLGNLYKKKEIPLWLVFAAQIFLDVNHIMRDRIADAFLHIKRTAIITKIQMSQVIDGPQHTMNWPKQNQTVAQTIWTFAHDWVMTDGMRRLAQLHISTQPTYPHEPYALLKTHPLLCGTVETFLRLLTRETGIALAMGWGTLLSVAHLYNLLRQTRVLATPWPDMELFIDLHTPAALFIGALPTTPEDCEKHYTLMLGLSVEHFARERTRRNNRPLTNKSGPRNWQTNPPLLQTITDRYVTQHGTIAWTATAIEGILNEVNASQRNLPKHLRKRWDKSHQLSHLQVLALLREALGAEQKALRFDYVAMHFRSLEFLRELRGKVDEELTRVYGKEYLEREDQIPTLVGYVMSAAAELCRTRPGADITALTLVEKSAEVMRRFVEREGDVEVRKLG